MTTAIFLGSLVRLVVIFMAFVAMWSLWIARRDRGDLWTSKMRRIWRCHFAFICAVALGNIELLYREVLPTASVVIIIYALIETVLGTFKGEIYTKTQR